MPNRSTWDLPAIFVDTPPSPPVAAGQHIPPAVLEIYDVSYLHFHRYIELGLCVSGQGQCYVEDQMQPFSAGDVQIIFPFQRHLSKSTGSEPCLWYWAFLDLPSALRAAGMAGGQNTEDWIRHEMPFSGIVDKAAWPEIAGMIRTLVENTCRPDPAAVHPEMQYAVEIMQLLLTMCKACRATKKPLALRSGSQLAMVKPALDEIKAAMEQGTAPNVVALSDRCGMSTANFRRVFHRATGSSPRDYILACAVRKARMLLLTTDEKIVDIAYAVGFEDISGFNRCFLRVAGMRPSEYRRKYR